MNAPISLVPVDVTIASSYDKAGKTGGPREGLVSLSKLGKAGVAVPEMAYALKRLSDEVFKAGGDFRVTECHRDVAVQKAARQKYDNWVQAGKPPPGFQRFDPKTMKAAFVAHPGRSGHNAGRSIDVHLGVLNFPGVPKDKQLDKLWEIAKPLGWEPIVKGPDESASEAWHFDFWGELAPLKARMGYEQAARAGAILVGHGDIATFEAVVQALLLRAGHLIGPTDGIIGPKTMTALAAALGCSEADAKSRVAAKDATVHSTLLGLPAK